MLRIYGEDEACLQIPQRRATRASFGILLKSLSRSREEADSNEPRDPGPVQQQTRPGRS